MKHFKLFCVLLVAACASPTDSDTNAITTEGRKLAIAPADVSNLNIPKSTRLLELPKAISNNNWPMTGGYPDHVLHHLALGNDISEIWDTSIGRGNESRARLLYAPVVADDMIAVMDSAGEITALNKDGKHLWQTNTSPEDENESTVNGGLVHTGNAIYAATPWAEILKLDAADGAILWRKTMPSALKSAPILSRGKLIVITAENEVLALSSDDGHIFWQYAGLNERTTTLTKAAAAANENIVMAAFNSGEVVALHNDTGRVIWDDSLSSNNRLGAFADVNYNPAIPILDRGLLMVTSASGDSAAWLARTGQKLWHLPTGSTQMPWAAGNAIFMLDASNQLLALNHMGQQYWQKSLPRYEDEEDKEDSIIWYGPIMAGNTIWLTGSHGVLLGLDPANGAQTAYHQLDSGAATAPIAAGNTLYVLTDDGRISAWK